MRTGKDRVFADRINEPINISNVQVAAGDIIVGDDSGVVVIPYQHAQVVYDTAISIETKENFIKESIKKGQKLKDARKAVGYHTLQAKIS